MIDPIRNFAIGDVDGGYDSDDVVISLQSGEGAKFPDPVTEGFYNLVWWNATEYPNPADDGSVEIITVIEKTGDDITIIRGREGTTASLHNLVGRNYKMQLAYTKQESDKSASNYGESRNRQIQLGAMDSFTTSFTSNKKQRLVLDSTKLVYDEKMDGSGTPISFPDGASVSTSAAVGIAMSEDGTKLFTQSEQTVLQYTLSTPWDITTKTLDYNKALPVAPSNWDYTELRFSGDGMRLFIAIPKPATTDGRIVEFNLSAPYDISAGLATVAKTHEFTGKVDGFTFSPDGLNLYTGNQNVSSQPQYVRQYKLTSPFELTNRTLYHIYTLPADENYIFSIGIHPTGNKLYLQRAPSASGVVTVLNFATPFDSKTLSVGTAINYGVTTSARIFIPKSGLYIFRYLTNGAIHKRSLYSDRHIELSDGVISVLGLRLRGQTGDTNSALGLDGSGNITTKNVILQGGNAYGAQMEIGTTDNNFLTFKTNGSLRGWYTTNGYFYAGNNMSIGTTNAYTAYRLQVSDVGNTYAPGWSDSLMYFIASEAKPNIVLHTHNAPGGYIMRRANGPASAVTSILSNEILGQVGMGGFDSSNYGLTARIYAVASENWSASARGTRFGFYVTPIGSLATSEVVRIHDSGEFVAGNTLGSTVRARVNAVDSVRSALAGVGSAANYHLLLHRAANANGTGPGIAFLSSTDTTNVGAAIIHNRTSSNSLGDLDFYLKDVTTAGVAPNLKMKITSTGNLLVGDVSDMIAYTNVASNFRVSSTTSAAYIHSDRVSNDAFSGGVRVRKARGTYSSMSAVLSNDVLGIFGATGHTGTAFSTIASAYVSMSASENWTPTANGSRLSFLVTPDGSTTPRAVAIMDQDGTFNHLLRNYSTSTDVALTNSHNCKLLVCNSASPIELTIQLNAVSSQSIGSKISFMQIGDGAVTVTPETDGVDTVVLLKATSLSIEKNAIYTLLKIDTDTWVMTHGIN